jgi:hypothetical protein
MAETERLDKHNEIETSLLIFESSLQDFDNFLDVLDIADDLMIGQGYEGIYQLASFHPDYCFADSEVDDPANYTNRAPYPIFHLLRESCNELSKISKLVSISLCLSSLSVSAIRSSRQHSRDCASLT